MENPPNSKKSPSYPEDSNKTETLWRHYENTKI